MTNGFNYEAVVRASRTKRRSRSPSGPRVLHDERDPAQVRKVVTMLSATAPSAEGLDWMQPSQVVFVLMDDDRVVREIGLLDGAEWTRDVEFHDLALVDPRALHDWLSDHGVDLPYPPDRE